MEGRQPGPGAQEVGGGQPIRKSEYYSGVRRQQLVDGRVVEASLTDINQVYLDFEQGVPGNNQDAA